jgi:hypothetical protein
MLRFRWTLACCVSLAAGVMGLGSNVALAAQGQQAGQAGSSIPAAAQQLFKLANEARAAAGVGPLKWDSALAAGALLHCERMVAEGPIAHRYGGELDLTIRAQNAGAHFSLIAENVALGSLYCRYSSGLARLTRPSREFAEPAGGLGGHCGCGARRGALRGRRLRADGSGSNARRGGGIGCGTHSPLWHVYCAGPCGCARLLRHRRTGHESSFVSDGLGEPRHLRSSARSWSPRRIWQLSFRCRRRLCSA